MSSTSKLMAVQMSNGCTMDRGESPVNLLTDRLSAVVKEHYSMLFQEENKELERLRHEVQQLRGQVSRLSEVTTSPEKVVSQESGSPELHMELVYTPAGHGDEPALTPVSHTTKQEKADLTPNLTPISQGLPTRDVSFVSKFPVDEKVFTPSAELQTGHSKSSTTNNEILDLQKKFDELDPEKDGYIDITIVVDQMTEHLEGEEKVNEKTKFKRAIHKLNKQLGILIDINENERRHIKGQLQFPAFKVLMLEHAKVLYDQFGKDVAASLIQIRNALIQDVIVEQIAHKWRVARSDVKYKKEKDRSCLSERSLKMMDPLIGAMICLNAVQIGLSLDIESEWDGWLVIEAVFTCFFLGEFIFCILVRGCAQHFFGEDWTWSWFDFAIVASAVFDTAMSLVARYSGRDLGLNLNHFLILRLVRLIRITRLIRILRLKMFKELTLMVNGVIAGLRTLVWAVVLLTIFIYALGVLLRQVMMDDSDDCVESTGGTINYRNCKPGEELVHKYGDTMFGTVGRSMLTIFMCFTDGCGAPDGTPLIWHLWDSHGPLMVIGYVGAFLFVSFGVLNLIMAVFVENTMAQAQRTDAERQYGELSNHVKKAHELNILLGRFCMSTPKKDKTPKQEPAKGVRKLIDKAITILSPSAKETSEPEIPEEIAYPSVNMRITQDQFEDMLMDEKVCHLLDDLEISCISRQQLFDILDADGNGYLAISELVNGIMKLRGPADKGDGVAACLMIRQVQKQLGRFEESVNSRMQDVEKKLDTKKDLRSAYII